MRARAPPQRRRELAKLSSADHRRGRAVRSYGERRLAEAQTRLQEPLLSAFRAFCSVWRERYDWSNPALLRDYLALNRTERRELYQRFARECRMWEATLRMASEGSTLPELQSRMAEKEARREGWRGRLREMEEREARTRLLYERLNSAATGATRGLGLPWDVRDAYRALGLQPGAPMEEVRRRYRSLAMEAHPDRKGDHDRMSELNHAYRRLVEHLR